MCSSTTSKNGNHARLTISGNEETKKIDIELYIYYKGLTIHKTFESFKDAYEIYEVISNKIQKES